MKAIFLVVLLSGCGAIDRCTTRLTGNLTYKCSSNGVEYVQSDSGLALHVDADGKPTKCKE